MSGRRKTYSVSAILLMVVLAAGGIFAFFTTPQNTQVADPNCAATEDDSERVLCWHDYVSELVTGGDTAAALDTVAVLYREEPGFQASCHDFMHTIGELSYYRFMNDETFTVSPNISLCTFGFYHGFLDTLIQTTGDYGEAREFCEYTNTLLAGSGLPDDTLTENCYHGIGHGTIDEHRPDQSTDPYVLTAKTLTMCETVTETDRQLHDCATGVFNGVANYYMDGSLGWELDYDDPVAICKAQPERYKNTCNAFMARVILALNEYDVPASLLQIEAVIEPVFVGNVIKNLTLIQVAGLRQMTAEQQSTYISACQALQVTENQEQCIQGLAAGLVQAGSPEVPYEAVTGVCFDPTLHEAETAACLQYAYENISKWYTKKETDQYCQQLYNEHKTTCLN